TCPFPSEVPWKMVLIARRPAPAPARPAPPSASASTRDLRSHWSLRQAYGSSELRPLGLDDVRPGGDQLVLADLEVAAGGLGILLPGRQVGLVDAEDLDELDPVDLADDAVELALVQRAAELPAVAVALRRTAHERVQVGVERVGDVLLDPFEVG